MRILKTISTARLLALVLGVVAAASATAAIALAAASGGGPKPPPKALAQAVHDALSAPKVEGVSARVRFTDHLVDSSVVTGSNPLVSGASGRLWASSDGRLRVELQSVDGDVQLVSDGRSFMLYDGSSNTAYRGALPREKARKPREARGERPPALPRIQRSIDVVRQHALLSGAIPSTVAGRPAYEVRVTPRRGGLVSGARLAWDAIRGIPLRIAVYARGDRSPVLALTAEDVSYGPVSGAVFAITPPKGAHVVDLMPRGARGDLNRRRQDTGVRAVRAALPFKLAAPPRLAGKSRERVELIGSGALVTYGRGLDGLVVIEQKAEMQAPPSGRAENGVRLPTVSIGGATAEELPTALGSLVRFVRGGVDYTVVGSQPAATVLAAARAL